MMNIVKDYRYTAEQMQNAARLIRSGRMDVILSTADDLERQSESILKRLDKLPDTPPAEDAAPVCDCGALASKTYYDIHTEWCATQQERTE